MPQCRPDSAQPLPGCRTETAPVRFDGVALRQMDLAVVAKTQLDFGQKHIPIGPMNGAAAANFAATGLAAADSQNAGRRCRSG